jgi:hypothetical protein
VVTNSRAAQFLGAAGCTKVPHREVIVVPDQIFEQGIESLAAHYDKYVALRSAAGRHARLIKKPA